MGIKTFLDFGGSFGHLAGDLSLSGDRLQPDVLISQHRRVPQTSTSLKPASYVTSSHVIVTSSHVIVTSSNVIVT